LEITKSLIFKRIFRAILQYPGKHGQFMTMLTLYKKAADNEIKVAVAADILSLVKLTPGEIGAAVVGTTQRFGIPMGYGGPHAAYFATKEEYKRSMPGRIIVSAR
jgi:glycine dehydrogenase